MIDRDKLLQRTLGDQEFLREIAMLFLNEDCPARLADIRSALAANDAEALCRSAHTFKGAVANFEAPPVVEAALELEAIARDGDLDRGQQAFGELETLVGDLRGELSEMVGLEDRGG